MKTALVLAGGGVAGIAWEIGVLAGIEEAVPELADALLHADLIVGTSAGATVAAQITSGSALSELYESQVRGISPEIEVELTMTDLFARFAWAAQGADSAVDLRRRIGALALETVTVSEAERRGVIERRLPRHEWPQVDLRLVAVDAATGEERIFDRHSGVPLVDAVAASCAVPGVWPPVTIGSRRYVDGGIKSSSNVDVARGSDRVVVLSPANPDLPTLSGVKLEDQLAGLAPAEVTVIHAGPEALAAFGTNPLSSSTRRPSAEAGRLQGLDVAHGVWSSWIK